MKGDEAKPIMTITNNVEVQDEGIEVQPEPPAVVDEADENDLEGPAQGTTSGDEDPPAEASELGTQEVSHGCCGCGYDGVAMAKGISLLATARGPIVMSNVFLSSALLFLASEEVGCVEEVDGEMVVVEDCNERVYRIFQPAALITNIAVISGLLSAFLMPVAGAIIDFTNQRWTVGVVSAILITVIQIVQVGTNSATWFPMAILQAIAGFLYQIQVVATWAYLPDIARKVSEQAMTRYTSNFTMVQFASQAIFLFVVVGIATGLGTNDVQTGRISQGINSLGIVLSFKFGWGLMPIVPARNQLEEGKSLIVQGFRQNWNTAKRINKEYKRSLRWFLLAILFAEPAANAFTVVAVVFLSEQMNMSGNDIGIFFFTVLVAMVPGGLIFHALTIRTDPNTSFRISMFMMFLLIVVGALVLDEQNVFPVAYIWGIGVGLILGCYYPCQQLFYSFVVPRGQETEFTGFYIYCTQLLVWLPPLVFSTMVESNVDQRIGLMATGGFFLIAIGILSLAPKFDELVEEVHSNDKNRSSFRSAGLSGLETRDLSSLGLQNDEEAASGVVPRETSAVHDAEGVNDTNAALLRREASALESPNEAPSADSKGAEETDDGADEHMDTSVKCEVLMSGRLRIPPAKPRDPKTPA